MELIGGTKGSSKVGTLWTPQGLRNTGVTDYMDTGWRGDNTASGTIVWKILPVFTSTDNTAHWMWGHSAGPPDFSAVKYSDNKYYVGWNNGTDARVVVITSTANCIPNVWATYVFTWSPAGSALYRNGVLIGSSVTAPPVGIHASATFEFLNTTRFTTGGAATGTVLEYLTIYKRVISAAEILDYQEDPYGFIVAPAGNLRYFVPPPGTATATKSLNATTAAFAGGSTKSITTGLPAAVMSACAAVLLKSTGKLMSGVMATWVGTATKRTDTALHGGRRNKFDDTENLFYFSNNGAGFNTSNAIAAPDGNVTADTAREDTGTQEHYYSKFMGLGAGTYTLSVYLKKATGNNWVTIRCDINGASTRTWFDIFNGVVGTTGHASASISNAGSGWWRCSVTFTASSGLTNTGWGFASSGDGVFSYAGSTTNTTYVWGAQLENGSLSAYQVMPRGDVATTAGYAGTLNKGFQRVLGAVMATWVGVVAGVWTAGGPILRSLNAVTATMAGTVTKLTTRQLLASKATNSAAVTKLTSRSLAAVTATMAGTITQIKVVVRVLAAVMATMAGTATKQTSHLMTAAKSANSATLNRLTSRLLSAVTATMSGTLLNIRVILRALTATMAPMAGSLTRLVSFVKALSASTAAMAGTTTRLIGKGLSATTAAGSAVLNKTTSKLLNAATATMAGTKSQVKVLLRILTAVTAPMAGTLTRTASFGRSLSAATVAMSAGTTRFITRSLTAVTAVGAGTLNRVTSHLMSASTATMAGTVTRIKLLVRSFNATTATMSATFLRTGASFVRSLGATTGAMSASLTKTTARVFVATTLGFAATLTGFFVGLLGTLLKIFEIIKRARIFPVAKPVRIFGDPTVHDTVQFTQDRFEIVDYKANLTAEGDTIASVTWVVTLDDVVSTGLVVVTQANTTIDCTARISAVTATLGAVYKLSALIVAASGQKYKKSVNIYIVVE